MKKTLMTLSMATLLTSPLVVLTGCLATGSGGYSGGGNPFALPPYPDYSKNMSRPALIPIRDSYHGNDYVPNTGRQSPTYIIQQPAYNPDYVPNTGSRR